MLKRIQIKTLFILIAVSSLSVSVFAEENIYRQAPALFSSLANHSGKKPFQFRNANQAVHLMISAGRIYQELGTSGIADILKTLETSIAKHKSNSLAYFLKAYIYHEFLKDPAKEVKALEKFLSLSNENYGTFEEQFISPGAFFRNRAAVKRKLEILSPETQNKNSILPEAVQNFLKLSDLPNMIILGVVLAGGMLLLGCNMVGIPFDSMIAKHLIAIYLSTILSYVTWIFSFTLALPFEVNHLLLIPIIYAMMASAIFITHWSKKIEEANLPLEVGYARCPHCKAVIEKLLIECPECRKGIE